MTRNNYREYRINLNANGPWRKPKPIKSDLPAKTTTSSVSEAYRFKNAFQFEYRRLESNATGEASEYRPWGVYAGGQAWADLADRLRQQGIDDPISYVRTLVHEYPVKFLFVEPRSNVCDDRGGKGMPRLSPAKLAEPAMVKAYHNAVADGEETALLVRGIQKQIAEQNVRLLQILRNAPRHEALVLTLLDADLEMSSLFRYALAAYNIKEPAASPEQESQNTELRRICDDYYAGACVQYLGNVEGNSAAYGGCLPRSFARDAEELYETLINSDIES